MTLVIDTNVLLDLWVFRDPRAAGLQAAISNGELTWVATTAMRGELESVLSYAQISARMDRVPVSAQQVLDAFDRHAVLVDAPPASALRCRDPDDQKFVDLAVAQGASLLSKDRHLLALRRKLPVAASLAALPR